MHTSTHTLHIKKNKEIKLKMGKIVKQWLLRRHSSLPLPIEPLQTPWSAISQLLSLCPCAHMCNRPRFASLCFSFSWPCYTLLTSQQGESYCHQANPPFLGLPIKKNPSISNKISLLPEADSCLALQSSVPCYCEKTWDMNTLCPYSLLTEEKKKCCNHLEFFFLLPRQMSKARWKCLEK